ncbi:hypothetical protein [Ponticaulis sp.]|uniref:hypothetical protein n=1 Tax=Ponticaulis sp. TaxID=2020902 RepID=UPI000C45C805|nr:hypothetical protein [Ponticaulis sp.]MAF56503.1 hypothetical protein [Ponticaulis sp.]MBN06044.1 hypothetical protein [Ponticaulis sp.]|tara:strand:+ start:106 stop:1815 length:1710 start_codon:yes stop_codon:yes gene_type:complete
MKLLIKEYLSSLKERGELDAILPDLLSEMGLHVFSRPAVGVRQHGVDLAAVGVDGDGQRKVFLFTVKAGNLTRQDWNGTTQAVRPSLDEIQDSYVRQRIPKQYAELPVAICICVGGDVDQNVDGDLSAYEDRYTKDGVEFQRWDGDRLANFMLTAVLGENVVSGEARSYFRKSVAMLDEPGASYGYFAEMLQKMRGEIGKRQKDKIRFVRQLNLCCWVLFVWAREADNIEAPYRCSELALLWGWHFTAEHLGKSSRQAKEMQNAMTSLIELHINIANAFITEKVLPHADKRDGLATAVNSSFALDVNLRLYEILGRLALTGIWLQFVKNRASGLTEEIEARAEAELVSYTDGLVQILNQNGILRSPRLDSHAIELSLVGMFLAMRSRYDVISDWMGQVLAASLFALQFNDAYPCILTEYGELAAHPKARSDKKYFENVTAGSTLYPTLMIWQKIANKSAEFTDASAAINEILPHCTMQLWVPNESSEAHLYLHDATHGLAVVGLEITPSGDDILQIVFEECRHNETRFNSLSAVKLSFWPIILVACRHHRISVPLNFWRDLSPLNDASA